MKSARIKVGEEYLTKADLCRRVLALKPDASPSDICRMVHEQFGVKINSGTASSIRSSYGGKKPIPKKAVAVAEKRTEKPPEKPKTPDVDLFIEGLKHVKEAVRLLGNKDSVIDLVELL